MGVRLSENESPDEALAERTPFIEADPASLTQPQRHDKTPKNTTRRLYISHTLSTWNSRIFEFGAVLYLASIYPGTLLPMSIYALSRGGAAILLAPAVGWYIDVGNRLGVVRVSIGLFSILNHIHIRFWCAVYPARRAADESSSAESRRGCFVWDILSPGDAAGNWEAG